MISLRILFWIEQIFDRRHCPECNDVCGEFSLNNFYNKNIQLMYSSFISNTTIIHHFQHFVIQPIKKLLSSIRSFSFNCLSHKKVVDYKWITQQITCISFVMKMTYKCHYSHRKYKTHESDFYAPFLSVHVALYALKSFDFLAHLCR